MEKYMTRRRRNNKFRNKQNSSARKKIKKTLKKENLKGRHLTNAKNQILIISEN